MTEIVKLKKDFDELMELTASLVKNVGGSFDGMTQEEIEKGFRGEYLTYAAMIALADGELDVSEVDVLEDVFDIRIDPSDVIELGKAYFERIQSDDCVPIIFKLAVTLDNIVAERSEVNYSLAYNVHKMYAKIAAHVAAADDALERGELLVITHFTLSLREYADENLLPKVREKWPEDDED